MKIFLKNTNYHYLLGLQYFGAIAFIVFPIYAISHFYQKNPLALYVLFIMCTVLLALIIKIAPFLTSELSFSADEIHIKKWGFPSSKKIIVSVNDLSRIEVTFGLVQKAQLILLLKNQNKLVLDLNYINSIEGNLPEVELSQYAPNDPTSVFTLRVASLISNEFKIPFETQYLARRY